MHRQCQRRLHLMALYLPISLVLSRRKNLNVIICQMDILEILRQDQYPRSLVLLRIHSLGHQIRGQVHKLAFLHRGSHLLTL